MKIREGLIARSAGQSPHPPAAPMLCPLPPLAGGEGEDPSRQRWGGGGGRCASSRRGSPPPHPDPLRPRGRGGRDRGGGGGWPPDGSRGAPPAAAPLILRRRRTLSCRRDRLLPTMLRRALAGGAIRGCRWGHRYLGAVAQSIGAVDNDA